MNGPRPVLHCGRFGFIDLDPHSGRSIGATTHVSHLWARDGEVIDTLCGMSVVETWPGTVVSKSAIPNCLDCKDIARVFQLNGIADRLHGSMNRVCRERLSKYVEAINYRMERDAEQDRKSNEKRLQAEYEERW